MASDSGERTEADVEFSQTQTRCSLSLGLTQSVGQYYSMTIQMTYSIHCTVSCFLKYDHDKYHMSIKSKTFFNSRPFGSLFPRRQNAHQSFLDPSIASSSSWQSL